MSLIVNIKKDLGAFKLHAHFCTDHGITCLLGASGSGKSMTLKCIAGLVTPDEGYIELDGRVLYDSSRKINLSPQERHVGYLFQNYALFPNMTVKKNLCCGIRNKDKKKKEQLVKEMLHMLQLSDYEDRYPSELSGGQMQRVALGRILLNEPSLLMLDEPFSALDGYLKDRLIPQMKRMLQSFPHGVLMVTHSREEAYRLSDYAAVICNGSVFSIKPIKELFLNPETIDAAQVTGCKNIEAAEKAGEYFVYVPGWKTSFRTAFPVRDDVKAIGIRAHSFHADISDNRQKVTVESVMEEPFEFSIEFRFEQQSVDTPALWWKISKENWDGTFPENLGVSPDHIMLLH